MNVIAFQMATGERRWYIMRCYLASDDGTTIRNVVVAMVKKLRGTGLIVAGDLNMDFGKEDGRGQKKEIATVMVMEGLEDLAEHLFLRRRAWCRDCRTWSTRRQGRVVRSWMDYILGSDRRILQNVAVQELRHNSNHFMVVGSLR